MEFTKRHWLKGACASIILLPVAVISAAHGLSSAALRKNPELSASIFPINGLAQERLAYTVLTQGVTDLSASNITQPSATAQPQQADGQRYSVDEAKLAKAAVRAFPLALNALRYEPLVPKAHVILAISDADPARKRQIVALSSQLNRRDLALQALVLEQSLADNDYPAVIETLDQILRVHPKRQADFFPLLVQALADEKTVPAFVGILTKPLPWRDAFLNFAVKDTTALANLARIRAKINFGNSEFDKRLVANLVGTGDIRAGEGVYAVVTDAARADGRAADTRWRIDYPPFDWNLSDRSGFRAQLSDDDDAISFEADPGNGGVVASRIIAAPKGAFGLDIVHDIEPAAQRKDIKIALKCWGQTESFFEGPLSGNANTFRLSSAPACRYLEVAIVARAWSDLRPITGKFYSLSVSEEPSR